MTWKITVLGEREPEPKFEFQNVSPGKSRPFRYVRDNSEDRFEALRRLQRDSSVGLHKSHSDGVLSSQESALESEIIGACINSLVSFTILTKRFRCYYVSDSFACTSSLKF